MFFCEAKSKIENAKLAAKLIITETKKVSPKLEKSCSIANLSNFLFANILIEINKNPKPIKP